ncbi:MAG: Short-chain dehydrogenase/reductase [Solirubrobacterales bacterium]|jgi:citronellol/citronellal dehydrogenase|nr:Short-chain dehydrogenase/reductase [Solirubrobacterales bacterium]
MSGSLNGKTIFMSGGSRGIGLAIALRAARDGANVALMAKSDQPQPNLEGTVHTAAAEIEEAGGRALAIVGDVRDADAVAAAAKQAADHFDGIDIAVNNASAINLTPLTDLPVKRFDLMMQINVRGTYVVSHACAPFLKEQGGHILTLSPPIDLDPKWLGPHAAYTLSKYGMSMLTLGLAEELRASGVAANCLWPRTLIATAAVQNLLGGEASMARSRRPEIMGDAAHAVLTKDPATTTGNCFIDDEVLKGEGVSDFSPYLYTGKEEDLAIDLFL